MTERLKKAFDKNRCDKGSQSIGGHHYWKVYGPKMEKSYDEEVNILEIGIWKGRSMKSFHESFPKAQLYGIDIFTRIKPSEVDVLTYDRVHWAKGNSRDSESVSKIMKDWGDIEFDYIIDDGEHTPMANKETFINFYPYLKSGGLYFIEDVWKLDDMTMAELNFHWLTNRKNQLSPMLYKNMVECLEKQGEVKHYDLRSRDCIVNGVMKRPPGSGNPDSYIIEVEKP